MLPGRSRSPSRFSFFPHRPLGQLLRKAKFYLTTRADSIAFYRSGKLDETGGRKRVCDGSPESMHGAAGAPPQLTDGACVAAQSTDVAALRHTLQARPLALRLHRERAIGAKSTDLCAVDFHVGRAQRADNRGSRMLSRTRAHRASGGPGGGRPSSPPERPWPGSGIKGGCFSVRPGLLLCEFAERRKFYTNTSIFGAWNTAYSMEYVEYGWNTAEYRPLGGRLEYVENVFTQ